MKLVTYLSGSEERLAMLSGDLLYDAADLHSSLPSTMRAFLEGWDDLYPLIAQSKPGGTGIPVDDALLLAPVPHPVSLRDGYAFRRHVETARRNRGLDMIPAFDAFPVFYFGNHTTVQGQGDIHCMPDHFEKLDYELECAIVICRQGTNIPATEADRYIGGLMIMNDMSARTLQMEEMQLSLGPAKGKDFCTVLGPWLVTTDELEQYETPCKPGHTGRSWNLEMTAAVNGITLSKGNFADMSWTFAELIERASYGATLYPGDVIGSGTVGRGCLLELNGTARRESPGHKEQWLQPGDKVALEVTGLGKLCNTIIRQPTHWSILNQKKKHADTSR
ncbi:fumarylacetoacetate hydrolase family protein [Agriterribacter sp.]|uniref:fumarylacetoacetate hydrolase family protein n=1 Tax=Agriterribacter sp. TaxID=2821509 RepID=UPI002BF75340|nr:fumarylacetoacetate hydrolase family protein [Agriterribacter sp.]HRP57932.1 fumarylacetoacetate hydrolase family protein [Agriterribacter sp.]